MKRSASLLLLAVYLFLAPIGLAQESITLETLTIDFWPDYDQPSVLVLISGNLAPSTSLPATITIPLPEDARLNAVAYLDPANGMMNTDFVEETSGVTITTPAPNFRVEYYLPYAVEESRHSFSFTWVSTISVNQLRAKVQQPTTASALTVEPAANEISVGEDGFTYHILPSQALAAGQPLDIKVNYNMTSSQLSATSLNNGTIDLQPAGPAPTSNPFTPTNTNWPLIAGVVVGIFVVTAIIVLYLSNRPKARVRKPRPVRQLKSRSTRFCHNCGEPVGVDDRFCRRCGTPAKDK